jgi:hypothetical protein
VVVDTWGLRQRGGGGRLPSDARRSRLALSDEITVAHASIRQSPLRRVISLGAAGPIWEELTRLLGRYRVGVLSVRRVLVEGPAARAAKEEAVRLLVARGYLRDVPVQEVPRVTTVVASRLSIGWARHDDASLPCVQKRWCRESGEAVPAHGRVR